MAEAISTHVVENLEWVDKGLFILTLARDGLAFTPGDCVALYNPEGTSRPYSIASGSQEASLRFLVRVFEDGAVSSWLAGRQPRDEVHVSAAFGWFRPGQSEPGEQSIFLATGTGVAPFLSCIKSPEIPTPRCLLYGVRYLRQSIGLDIFEGVCRVQLAISREEIQGHHHGYIGDLLDEPDTSKTHYYLCGLEEMVKQISETLENQGVPIFRIHREVFFHGKEAINA